MTKLLDIPEVEPEGMPGFERFWAAYPTSSGRRVAKVKARAAWKKYRLEAKTDRILALLARYKRSESWLKDRGQYVPMVVTWLNRQPWHDADPCAEQEAMAAHRAVIEESKSVAKSLPVVQKLAGEKVLPVEAMRDEWERTFAAWHELTVPKRREIIDAYKRKHGLTIVAEKAVAVEWFKGLSN